MKVDFNELRTRRGIFLLPNLLTTGCLFGGFYAIVAAIDGNGGVTTYDYDVNGRTTRITDPLGGVTLREFDAMPEGEQ